NTALTLLPACASALGAGFSDNSALTMALTAGCGCSEATKDTLLDSPYLAGAITVGASAGLTTWLTANTLAQGAVLGARYTYLLFTTKGGLFKGDSKLVAEVSTAPWSLTGKVFRLKGQGVPHLNRSGRGDQLVTLLVVTPESLTKKQRQLLEE
ncbi:unnamed protein product, partial [marine sediment metagenome]